MVARLAPAGDDPGHYAMTAWWLAGACLTGAGILLGWPARRIRRRRRAVIGGRHTVVAVRAPVRQCGSTAAQCGSTAARCGSTAAWSGSRLPWRTALDGLARVPPWRAVLGGAVLGGVGGELAGGPVAGFIAAAYAGLAVRRLLRSRADRSAQRAHRQQLDDLCALAADLRAGLPPVAAVRVAEGPDRLTALVRAAVGLAEQTGAPLADLVERIEADARAMARGLAAAEAQAAGARATAWLLAALPAGGIALGYGIGVDPLDILLHTSLGAGCAIGAVTLQLAGLLWAARLGVAGGTVAGGTVAGGTVAGGTVAGGTATRTACGGAGFTAGGDAARTTRGGRAGGFGRAATVGR
ncbi:type II secretion system F family protein [Plantactinospora sp. WMMB334]|uniref:type II secretion system F family protein n=1 Tax=Plantactinospora sp. WMMB334 TaxID=3404119 RepID=UPI003B9587A9